MDRKGIALSGGAWLILAVSVLAADWPQFLGPKRNGLSPETGLIDSFPETGPTLHWRVPGGVGMSGIAILGDTACTLVQKDDQQFVLALEVQTGKTLWEAAVAPAYTNSMGDGPRATPTLSADQVFVYTGEGVLAALDMAQGQVQWKHQPVLSLGGKPAEYGMACSPLVVGELVVVHVGAPEATVAAFDRQTGELRWKAGSNSPAGYSSPTMLNVAGKATVVAYCGDAVLGLDPETGVIRWQYPYVTDYACNIAVPLEINGQVLISSGESHGSTLLQVKDALVTPVWESLGAGSVLRNEWQTSLLVQGQLFGFDNVGSAGPVTNFTCVNAATGKPAWLQRRFGKGNAIAADGKLWLTTMEGELVLLRANPQKFEELARAQVLQTTRQAPSLANGRLYLRDGAEILCLDVRQK